VLDVLAARSSSVAVLVSGLAEPEASEHVAAVGIARTYDEPRVTRSVGTVRL
jgi:hypothetical protein